MRADRGSFRQVDYAWTPYIRVELGFGRTGLTPGIFQTMVWV
jgi:hypothetical protein